MVAIGSPDSALVSHCHDVFDHGRVIAKHRRGLHRLASGGGQREDRFAANALDVPARDVPIRRGGDRRLVRIDELELECR